MKNQKTCNLIANEFAALDFTNRGKEGSDLLLSHRLRQVVDNQVGLALVILGHNVLRSLHIKRVVWIEMVIMMHHLVLLLDTNSIEYNVIFKKRTGRNRIVKHLLAEKGESNQMGKKKTKREI